jgi:3-deoxy-manno-octulosonate cytidylyltransferase (CMP-KDO synthetase)
MVLLFYSPEFSFMKILGIIPARYGSTRLGGKPLLDIHGKSMIRRVYERATISIDDLYVATDDQRIVEEVDAFNGNSIMTSSHHNSGTNRCLEAYEKISQATGKTYDVIINIQGDEPLLDPEQLDTLKSLFTDEYIMMGTLVSPVNNPLDLDNESEAFVVFDKNKNALYFSRSVIPYVKGVSRAQWFDNHTFYKHVGMYAYTPEALEIFANLPISKLETIEGLEQNRWLENGYSIKVAITDRPGICVDTPEDLERIRAIIKKQEYN